MKVRIAVWTVLAIGLCACGRPEPKPEPKPISPAPSAASAPVETPPTPKKEPVMPELHPLFAEVPADSLQAIEVMAPSWSATEGTLVLWSRTSGGEWSKSAPPVPVVVGRAGMAWGRGLHAVPEGAAMKVEGDGKAPAGVFRLGEAFGAEPRPEGLKMAFTPLEEGVECVDDPRSMHYNAIKHRFRVGVYDWKSSEKMWKVGQMYSRGVFVRHNTDPVVKRGGSCIFLHIWGGPGVSTAGCSAVSEEAMASIVRWLDPASRPVLVQGVSDASGSPAGSGG